MSEARLRANLIMGAILAVLFTLMALFGPAAGRWEWLTLLGIGMAVVAVQYVRRAERVSENATPNDIARAMLRAQRCPSCGYTLSGVPKQEDGCVVCPECGGAWRAPRLTSPHPP